MGLRVNQKQIGELLKMIQLTKDVEPSCPECVKQLDHYVQAVTYGKKIDGDLKRVREHLGLCSACDRACQRSLEVMKAIEE